ncbi:MAG: DUF3990 domain-containing protein [Oscillospiraceae bacterium]|jgi:hypothetical protein|nr:DUF3990 domain-containing protein [Oscillospiraceae bacterium]
MILFHGTDRKIGAIDFTKSRLRTDFGRGFYLSDKLGNARNWAIDKSSIFDVPTVMRYNVKDEALYDNVLKRRRFDNPTIEWLDFVRDNRQKSKIGSNNKEPRHFYDIVSGPMANDKVAIAVDKYCRGVLTVEEALNEVMAIKNVFQLSMHTLLALTYIQSVSYSQYKNKKWSEWLSCK